MTSGRIHLVLIAIMLPSMTMGFWVGPFAGIVTFLACVVLFLFVGLVSMVLDVMDEDQ